MCLIAIAIAKQTFLNAIVSREMKKKKIKIHDDECFFLFLHERTCNTKVTTNLFYIDRASNMPYINNITE